MSTPPTTERHLRDGMKAVWRHLKPFQSQMTVLFFLGIVSSLANGFVPYVTGRFFDALIGVSQHTVSVGVGDMPLWASFLIVWAGIQLIANNIDWIADRLRRKLDTAVHFRIQTDGIIHLLRLPLTFHKNAHSNAELQKISMAGWRVSAIVNTTGNIAPQFLSIFIGIVLASTISGLLAFVLLAGVTIYAILLIYILRPIAAIDAAAHKSWNESWDDSAAAIQQVESVKQATAEAFETKKVEMNLAVKTQNLWLRLERNWNNINFFQRIIVFSTQLTIFLLSVHLVSENVITVGQLVALNGYALMFFGPVAALGNSWQVIQNGFTAAANAEKTFMKAEEIYTPHDAIVPSSLKGSVHFDHVNFAYAEGQPHVLTDLDFKVEPGQSIALVGQSGVGKSTAISLISGYHFPSLGAVTIDGIDTRRLDLIQLRRHIAVVPQEVALFNDTIRANIRYGNADASDADVSEAANKAHLDEFISRLPNGFDTLVGERGVKLSVGQKQRMAIARAILRNPAILILDEPTSALDAVTEEKISKSLEDLMKGRTTFIIAHRLSTVRKADKILVFENGRIAETGTHEELIQRTDGLYKKLYDYQIGLH